MARWYGPDHRAAKTEKLESLPTKACEVTGQYKALEAHHSVPRLFDGPNKKENYMILSHAFHKYLHSICDVDDKELVQERTSMTYRIQNNLRDDQKVESAKQKIRRIDDILMPEYIYALVHVLGKEYKNIIELTILSNFHTIRELTIENLQLKAKLDSI